MEKYTKPAEILEEINTVPSQRYTQNYSIEIKRKRSHVKQNNEKKLKKRQLSIKILLNFINTNWRIENC